TVFPTPTVDFTASSTNVCPDQAVTFTYTGNASSSGTPTFSWVFGNNATPATGSTSPATTSYSAAGQYNVTLSVTNSNSCYYSLTKKLYITVKEKPIVNFTASQTDFCTDTATVLFTPNITGGAPGPYVYAWNLDIPGSATSSATSPIHTYMGPAPKQYSVKLTVSSSNGCDGSVTKSNYVRLHKPQAGFTGPSDACVFTPVNFTNASPTTGASHTWDFGDNTGQLVALNGSHIYSAAGTYTVKVYTSIGGCVDSAMRTIIIHPQPSASIKQVPDSVCPAPQVICFKTVPAMSGYQWSIQDSFGLSTSTSSNPCHTYTTNGEFPVDLVITDANGCMDTIFKTVKIYELNIEARVNTHYARPPAYADSGCVPFFASFSVNLYRENKIPYPYGVKSYQWDFGDGGTSTSKNPTHTYTNIGHFRVLVTIETQNGCTIKDSLYIKTGYLHVVDSFEVSDTLICPRTWVKFVARARRDTSIYVKSYDTLKYHWNFGDSTKAVVVGDSVKWHFYQGGPPCIDSFTVKLYVSHNGCISGTKVEEHFVIKEPPCADFGFMLDSCDNRLRVRFINRSQSYSSSKWFFGDNDTSTLDNPVHIYPTKGKYLVTLIVHNDSTHCNDTMRQMIFFGDNPPEVVANKTELCVGDSVLFFAFLKEDTSFALFDWYLNGVKVSAQIDNYKKVFNQPGQYTIMVTTTNVHTNCIDTLIKNAWITVGGPTAGFVTDKTHLCNPDTVRFTDTSFAGAGTSIVRRTWYWGRSPGDTLTISGVSRTVLYDSTGDYDNGLVVVDNLGCADTVFRSQYIHVLKPDAAFNVQSPLCVGAEAKFFNGSTNAVKFRWNFGDGGIDTVNSDPTHIYNAMGTFNAQLVVTDTFGCKDTTALIPVETTKPIANFTLSDSMSVCAPLIVNFDGTVSLREKRYEWHFDDGSSPGYKKTHTVVFNDVKEYHVKLIVTDSLGCKDSITKPIQVLGYAGAFSYDPISGCTPLTVNFTSKVKGSIPTIIWDFGDGNTLLGSYQQLKVSHTYNTPGRYLPRMIFNNGLGCKVGSAGLDTILVDGVIADFETGPACQYSQVEFINKTWSEVTPIKTTNWTFHDGSFSALRNPKRNYGPPGTYKVKLVVTNTQGCIDSIEKNITINVPIEVSAGGDTIICLKDSAQLFPNGGVSYLWSPAATLSCTQCNNPFAFPQKKTVYTVISTDVNGCHDTGRTVVDIKTHVTSIVGEGAKICEGETTKLSVSGARTYLWSPGAYLDNVKSPAPSANPTKTTQFMVVAYEGSCIPDTNYVEVLVHPKPTVNVRGEKTIIAGTSADLLASGDNIVRFLWSPANTLSCADCANPIASPFKNTVYKVKVFTLYDCVDSADVKIMVLCDNSQLYIPNTFTPNGDGMNDIFMVRGSGISTLKSFRVYNRWGELLFERLNANVNDQTAGWDGTFNGAQLPPDVYVYMVEAYCENGDLLKTKGDITIIR
ncbi:MAG: PKD domain-containing protein, partial [Chitinophagaceae bacterium]|nr:PKD domain-containing protein [Chitinophagaceae bacterium]